MSLFGNKKKETKKESDYGIPELPKLPELPKMDGLNQQPLNQLPRFPSNALGDRFSQNTIKEAVSGEKEDGMEGEFDSGQFEDDDFGTEKMPLPPPKQFSREEFTPKRMSKKAEPVFIRLDKFEESLHLFEKTKKQIHEIEKMLNEIKEIKQEEEKELEFWENEMGSVKNQIEKVNQDLFSKIE